MPNPVQELVEYRQVADLIDKSRAAYNNSRDIITTQKLIDLIRSGRAVATTYPSGHPKAGLMAWRFEHNDLVEGDNVVFDIDVYVDRYMLSKEESICYKLICDLARVKGSYVGNLNIPVDVLDAAHEDDAMVDISDDPPLEAIEAYVTSEIEKYLVEHPHTSAYPRIQTPGSFLRR